MESGLVLSSEGERAMSLSLRVGIAAVLLSATLAAPASAGKHDGRIRVDAVHDWLIALRDPVDDPKEMPTAWTTALNCLRKIGPDDRVVLPELIVALNDPVPRVRAAAAATIGSMGPEARGAVPALRRLLPKPGEKETEDPQVITAVISALGQIGDDAVSAADDLVLCLDGAVDFMAWDTLERFGPTAIPALERGLRDSRPRIRRGCLIVLAAMRYPAPVAPDRQLELLGDEAEIKAPNGGALENMRVGCAAVPSLVHCGPSVAGSLRKLLASDKPVVRVRAASVLMLLNQFDAEIADRLAQGYRNEELSDEITNAIQGGKRGHDPRFLSAMHALLNDRDVNIRARAASVLIAFDAVDADVVRTEIAFLSDPAQFDQAADLFSHSVQRVKPFGPQLAEVARHGNLHARWIAAGLLACVAPNDPAIAANLIEMKQKVRVQDATLQHYGVLATFLMGEKGFPTLCKFLERGEAFGLPDFECPQKSLEKLLIAEIRRAAPQRDRTWNYVSTLIALAATNCSGDSLVPCLPILLDHACPPSNMQFPDPGTDPASACLAKCGKAALPLLINRLRDPKVANERLTELVDCLGRLGPRAREALPLLASNEMLARVDDSTKLVTAINSIGPTAECLPFLIEAVSSEQSSCCGLNTAILSLGDRARPAIVGLLASERPNARLAGRTMILQLGKKAETDIPTITGILARGAGDEGPLMQILATFGPPARIAVPAVAKRLNSPYVRIRSTACITLGRIASGSREARAAVTDLLVAATNDDFAEVRAAAADALGLLGTPDGVVSRALEPLRHDPFATVRNAAERALKTNEARYGPSDKAWTIYFDSSGPATGPLFAANE
jgi:HEAT repeat protein